MLTHIVFFKLNERTPESAAAMRDLLLTMKGKIDLIKEMEVGINVVESARAYDVALVQKFDSVEAMQAYQTHPLHVEILPRLRAMFSVNASVDYES